MTVARTGGEVVLAYGEATGHRHAIADRHAELLSVPGEQIGQLFLRITGSAAVLEHPEHKSIMDLLVTITRSCGWCWPHKWVCVLTERPTTLGFESVADGPGRRHPRPHCADGPALAYRDGRSHYSWHGVQVPAKIITGELTTADWLKETNTEVRRVIAERVGYPQLLDQCQASRIGTDEYGTLWRLRHPHETEAVVLLDVVNSTPEPDGSFRRYVLRVPPDQTVPRDAIGWTFGLPAGQYRPISMT